MIIRSKKKKKTLRKILTVSVFIAVIAATYLTGRFLPQNIADFYSREIFPSISSVPQRLSSLAGFSLTEITVIVLGIIALPLLTVWLVLLVKKSLTIGVGKYLYKSLRNVLAVSMVLLILFELLHGLNYRRTPARAVMGLGSMKLTFEDYCDALEWSYDGMIRARKELAEDENGVARLSTDFDGIAEHAAGVVDSFCASYGVSPYKGYSMPKSVKNSHYWSYTYIVGTYNPIYGEANVNTDYEDATSLPSTTCHELCHSKGFANETDCNFLGAIACITSERADFRYSGYYTIFTSLLGQIEKMIKTKGYKYDFKFKNEDIAPVVRDIRAYNSYWKKIDDEVLEIQKRFGINITEQSLEANNKFLESNGEKGGSDTYNVPENEYVEFYLKYICAKGGADA